MFDRYNIVSENDLRMAAQKTTMYVDNAADDASRAVNGRCDAHVLRYPGDYSSARWWSRSPSVDMAARRDVTTRNPRTRRTTGASSLASRSSRVTKTTDADSTVTRHRSYPSEPF